MKSAFFVAFLFATGLAVGPAGAATGDDFEPAPCIDNGGIGPDPFVDVADDAFSRDGVAWAFDNDIVEGTDSTHFSPDGSMTRGQFAAVLHRSACNPVPGASATFDDLRVGAFYLDAVDWLVGEGLTTGITPNQFGPERTLTRAEFVTFLHRLVGEPTGSPGSGFTDVPADAFYAEAVDWALHRGITTGTSPTTFTPSRDVTRGEAVTFLYRLHTIGDVQAHFTTVLSGLDTPIGLAQNPATGTWFITEKGGDLVRWTGSGSATTVLTKAVSGGNEQGLLSVAFTAEGTRMYVSYTDPAGTSVVDEHVMSGDTPGAMREVIRVAQPEANHNGGHVAIGPDGFLYFGLGDGGGGNDPAGNGQSLDTLLGKILRIDPATPSGGRQYGIPADNPFVGVPGFDQIWLSGVRNPWRFSFDQATGDLWVGDVGQSAREEITRLRGSNPGRGANLGWRLREGSIATPGVGGPAPVGHVGPVHEYDLAAGQSVTGGHVYRGAAIPALTGAYLWADFLALRDSVG